MTININADVRVYASDLILKLYSDASYLSAGQGRSRTGGCFFLGSIPKDGKDIKLNGKIHIRCENLKLVAVSTEGAGLGALFLGTQETIIVRLSLLELSPSRNLHEYM